MRTRCVSQRITVVMQTGFTVPMENAYHDCGLVMGLMTVVIIQMKTGTIVVSCGQMCWQLIFVIYFIEKIWLYHLVFYYAVMLISYSFFLT